MKKKERIFISGLIILAVFLWIGSHLFHHMSFDTIKITVDGEFFGSYSLSQDQIIHINDTNICEIKDNKAKMIHGTCPDHLCMKQNPVNVHGGTIVCLPNKVVIEGGNAPSSDDLSEVDAIN